VRLFLADVPLALGKRPIAQGVEVLDFSEELLQASKHFLARDSLVGGRGEGFLAVTPALHPQPSVMQCVLGVRGVCVKECSQRPVSLLFDPVAGLTLQLERVARLSEWTECATDPTSQLLHALGLQPGTQLGLCQSLRRFEVGGHPSECLLQLVRGSRHGSADFGPMHFMLARLSGPAPHLPQHAPSPTKGLLRQGVLPCLESGFESAQSDAQVVHRFAILPLAQAIRDPCDPSRSLHQ